MAYEYDRFEREDGGGSFLMGLLAGTVLGAGLGMLFAPKAGTELRNQLVGAGRPAADDRERRLLAGVGEGQPDRGPRPRGLRPRARRPDRRAVPAPAAAWDRRAAAGTAARHRHERVRLREPGYGSDIADIAKIAVRPESGLTGLAAPSLNVGSLGTVGNVGNVPVSAHDRAQAERIANILLGLAAAGAAYYVLENADAPAAGLGLARTGAVSTGPGWLIAETMRGWDGRAGSSDRDSPRYDRRGECAACASAAAAGRPADRRSPFPLPNPTPDTGRRSTIARSSAPAARSA